MAVQNILFPSGIWNLDFNAAGQDLGWVEIDGNRTLAEIANDIVDTGAGTNASHAIPSPIAHVKDFKTRLDNDDEDALNEWRGMLAVIALREARGYEVSIRDISLSQTDLGKVFFDALKDNSNVTGYIDGENVTGYIDNNGNTKYYVDVDKINVEDGNPANITVPIINPYKPIEYSIGLGKKLATGKLSDYKYPENLSDVEKELINDTSKFVSGAKFSVKQAFSQGNGNNTAWKDLGEVDENNNQVVVSKNGGYTDITGDEIPTGYSFIWYRIQEIAPVSGGKLNSNVYYVLMENYIQNSAEGNGVLVHLYKNPEINSETQIPIRDKNHEISTRIEGNGDIFIADKEDGFMVFFDTSTNSIQFVMVDENNTKKYNVNLAKINKDDIKDFSLEELNSDSIKQKMVENVKFNVKQEKKTTTEYLTEKNEKTVTTYI